MSTPSRHSLRIRNAFVALITAGGLCIAAAQTAAKPPPRPNHPAAKGHKLDHSGRKQVGKASFYARKFNGRTMADGTPMDPREDNAASRVNRDNRASKASRIWASCGRTSRRCATSSVA